MHSIMLNGCGLDVVCASISLWIMCRISIHDFSAGIDGSKLPSLQYCSLLNDQTTRKSLKIGLFVFVHIYCYWMELADIVDSFSNW